MAEAHDTAERNRGRVARWELAAILAILLLAAVLRMGWPGLTEFKGDEARLTSLALEMATFTRFPVRGISSSIGFPNTAVAVWLYALPLFLWRHVYAATLFTGLLNTVAVAGCWWFARRYWGPAAALAAALLFAVSPWALVHARKIWAQNLLAPLAVGWAITAALALAERRSWLLVPHLLLLALAAQTHFAGLALAPATAVLFVLYYRRLRWQPLMLGVGLALLSGLPFLYHLWAQSDASLGATLGGAGISPRWLAPWRYALQLLTGRNLHSLAGPDQFEAYLAQLPDLTFVHMLWAVLAMTGLLVVAWWARPRNHRGAAGDASRVLLLWLLAPPLFFIWFPGPLNLHYLLPAMPALFTVAGVASGVVVSYLRRWQPAFWLLLLGSAGMQVWAWAALLATVGAHATPGGFGTPLGLQLSAATAAQQLQEASGAREILVVGRGERPNVNEFAAVYDVLLWDTPHRFVDAGRTALFPREPAVVLADAGLATDAIATYQSAATATLSQPLRPGEGPIQLLALPAAGAPEPGQALAEPAHFANGVVIYGYDRPESLGEGKLSWRLYWQPQEVVDDRDYHFFNHMLDAAGMRIAQEDAPLFGPRQWQDGDTVVSHFTLSPSPDAEPELVRSGVYVFSTLENVPRVDAAGSGTFAVDLPLTPEAENGDRN